MTGFLLLVLVLAAVVGGVAAWMQHSRPQVSHGPATVTAPGVAPQRRVSLLVEAVGYIGTILVVAGAVAAVGQRWSDISTTGRLVILGCATAVFAAVGWLVRKSAEPAFDRLTGATWAVSVAGFAGSAAVVNQYFDTSARTAFLTIAVPTTAYAALLWLLHRHAIQHGLLFAGVLVSTAAVLAYAIDSVDDWMIALPLWGVAVLWAVVGWQRRIEPWAVAVALGLLVALVAPATITDISGLRFGLGIATAAVVMAVGVVAKFPPGLAIASVAMFGYVVGAVTFYFHKTLGVPASLAITGLLILLFAAVAMRWHWFGSRPGRSALPRRSGPKGPSEP